MKRLRSCGTTSTPLKRLAKYLKLMRKSIGIWRLAQLPDDAMNSVHLRLSSTRSKESKRVFGLGSTRRSKSTERSMSFTYLSVFGIGAGFYGERYYRALAFHAAAGRSDAGRSKPAVREITALAKMMAVDVTTQPHPSHAIPESW